MDSKGLLSVHVCSALEKQHVSYWNRKISINTISWFPIHIQLINVSITFILMHSQMHYLFILHSQIHHCAISNVGDIGRKLGCDLIYLHIQNINWIIIEIKLCNSVCWSLGRPKLIVLISHLLKYNVHHKAYQLLLFPREIAMKISKWPRKQMALHGIQYRAQT